MDKITFELEDEQCVIIKKNGKKVGHMFTPSGSGHDCLNSVQICGCSEIFDFWGCAIFPGFKDVQLLFDGKKMEGDYNDGCNGTCIRCYMSPCQCENTADNVIQKVTLISASNPFDLKRSHLLEDRLKYKNDKKPMLITGDDAGFDLNGP